MKRRICGAVAALVVVATILSGCSSTAQTAWSSRPWPGIHVSRLGGQEPLLKFSRGLKLPTKLVVVEPHVGNGPAAKPTSSLYLAYMSVVISTGQLLYSSWRLGHAIAIPLAKTPVAWQKALVGIKPGGTRIIIAPPDTLGDPPGSVGAKQGPVIFVVSVASVS